MSDGTPPSRRVEEYADRLRRNPLGEPSGGRTLGWFLSRLGIVAGIAVGAVVVVYVVVFFALGGMACACTPVPPTPPPSPVVGVVIAVDSPSLGQVKTFVLRLHDASTVTFTLGTLENATQFSPSHLAEHMATSVPVRAFYRMQNGLPTVYRLEDAPA